MSTGLEYLLSSFDEEQTQSVLNQTQPTLPFHYCFSPPFIMPLSSLAPPPVDPLASLSGSLPASTSLEAMEREIQQRNLNGMGLGVASASASSNYLLPSLLPPLYPPASTYPPLNQPLFPPEGGLPTTRLEGEWNRRIQQQRRDVLAASGAGVAARQEGEVDEWEEYDGSFGADDFESDGEDEGFDDEEDGFDEDDLEEAMESGHSVADTLTAAPNRSRANSTEAAASMPAQSLQESASAAEAASPGPAPQTPARITALSAKRDEEDATPQELQDSKPPAKPRSKNIAIAADEKFSAEEKPSPSGKKRKAEEVEGEPSACCICLDPPTPQELSTISCGHPFCFSCIEKWAERENTCPLCKARFTEIKRANHDGASPGEKSKRVCDRDQRTDLSSLNPLNGMYAANRDSQGSTWPTHIAQLLFTGLGASINGTAAAARRASDVNPTAATADALRRASETAARAPAPPRVGFSSRSHPPAFAPPAGREVESFNSFFDRINSHRQQQQELQRNRTMWDSLSTQAAGASASTVHPFSPYTTTRRTTTTTTTESTPWGSRSSIQVDIGPPQLGGAAASPLAFSPFGSPSVPHVAAAAPAAGSLLGNPFASINITRREEEEEILSAISPSSYIQRLQREMQRNSERQQYVQAARRTAVTDLTRASANMWNDLLNDVEPVQAAVGSNAAGRSAETALEIDDSDSDDDDVVEVVAVEAMM